jgi:hypothetical protein
MDQRSIVLYLPSKELSAIVIHGDLAPTPSPEAVNYSLATRCLPEAIFISSNSPIFPRQNLSSTIVTGAFSSYSMNSRLRQLES